MAQTRTEAEIQKLWQRYFKSRSVCLRDRICEYYFPWFERTAAGMARRINLEDVDDAVGDACLALSEKIIPIYDGRIPFEGFAAECIKRLFISRKRQRGVATVGCEQLNNVPVLPSPDAPESDMRFSQLTQSLPHIQAVILWMRFYRGLNGEDIASLLKIPLGTVKSRTSKAMQTLRKNAELIDLCE